MLGCLLVSLVASSPGDDRTQRPSVCEGRGEVKHRDAPRSARLAAPAEEESGLVVAAVDEEEESDDGEW